MAWIESEKRFLNREERAERINDLKAYIQTFLDDIDSLSDEELIELNALDEELQRLERVHRAEVDLLYFAWEYFSEKGNPGNQGNWEGFDIDSPEDAAQFHKEICAIMDDVSNNKRASKTAVAAPRGHAKSTYLSKAFPIREVVFRKRKYIMAISISANVTEGNLEWIKWQLKGNQKLIKDFGPLLHKNQNVNLKITGRDNATEVITWSTVDKGEYVKHTLIEAATAGQALRGRNWNGTRPDLVICDDLEDLETNADTEHKRQKLKNWFQSVVIPLGDPSGKRTTIVYMGTTIHQDCLLMDILHRRTDFKSIIYRAIINEPERIDLWEQCEKIYKNPDKPKEERAEEAWQFYQQHKEEMLKGSKVLWEESQDLWTLYKWKWDNGSRAFSTEYLNNPIDKESILLDPETFTYYDPNMDFRTDDYYIYFGVDFAMGKQRSDYCALTVLARHKRTGTCYVADSVIVKMHPDQFLDLVVDKVLYWQPDKIAADANVAQEFIVYNLRQRLRAAGYPEATRIKEIKDRTKKELRIESLIAPIKDGHIQFNAKHRLLLEQFEQFGTGSKDDGPDSVEMAYSVAKVGTREVAQKPWWL